MYQEILKKKLIWQSRKPYQLELRKQIKNEELCELIYTSLRLDGSTIKKENVQQILDGEFVVAGTTVNDHLAIQNYIEAVSLMDNLIDMESDLSLKVIEEIHDINCGSEGPIWRKHNPILYTFDYTPPAWRDIESKMQEFIKWTYNSDNTLNGNVILKAVYIHNKLIEIYPFEYNGESTARLVMYYFLRREGFPMFEMRVSETEYNNYIFEYLHGKKVDGLYKLLERGIYNKLDVLIQRTEKNE
ncbi:MAG: Fic family protein [Aminipila sp.]